MRRRGGPGHPRMAQGDKGRRPGQQDGLRGDDRGPNGIHATGDAQPQAVGWERIYEGAFVEAVLVNQLNGDFPGPVLAAVAVPVYSADRQRIVIPRGTRVVGSASATLGRDQARLAVGFHRLIFPDGRWVSLEFRGLNQIGESALRDQVNRHGVIRLSPARSKTLVGRILPISHPIAEALARRRARRNPDSPLVFHRDGIPHPPLAHGVAHRLSGGRRADPLPS